MEENVLGLFEVEDFEELMSAIKADEHFEVRKVKIECISSITERGDGDLATIILDKKLPRMMASKEDEKVFVEGKSNLIQEKVGSLIGVAKRVAELQPYILQIKADPTQLGNYFAGANATIVQLRVPAHTKWCNPFSEAKTVREYDEDRILSFIASIELSEKAKKLIAAKQILSAANISAETLLSLF